MRLIRSALNLWVAGAVFPGAAPHYPVGDRQTWRDPEYIVGSYSHFDRIFPTRRIERSAAPSAFLRAGREPRLHYRFAGEERTIDQYLAHFPVTGFLLIRENTILLERYQFGRTDRDRFTSQSMAKSMMALLVGVALGEGKIRSINDHPARYVPALAGSALGETPLRILLQMSSGIAFDEPAGNVADSRALLAGQFSPRFDMAAQLRRYRRRVAPPGGRFHYSSGDNEAAAVALRGAIGMSLSQYLQSRIWQPIGAEADARWAVDTGGQEITFMGFNATLRDYGRIGRLLAYDGVWDGRRILPRNWLIEATTVRPEDRQVMPGAATPFWGYGYQIWIFPGRRRTFAFRGADSQYVFVDPESKLVLVQTAVKSEGEKADNGQAEAIAVWLGIDRQFRGFTARR